MAMREPGAGELSRRVLIRQREDLPADIDADLSSTFPKQVTVWAKVEPVGAAIYSASVQTGEAITHRITLRYRPGITSDFEIVTRLRGRQTVYRVRRSAPLGTAHRFLVLEVEELWTPPAP